jgi:hypothetical protein
MLREKLPVRSLGELKAVFYCVLQKTVETTWRRGRFTPNEILAKKESLLP